MVTISPVWTDVGEEILHAHKFHTSIDTGLKLAQSGIKDLGFDGDAAITCRLRFIDTDVLSTPAGAAYDVDRFALNLRDFIAFNQGALNAIETISLTGLHEVVHCLRFRTYPRADHDDVERRATEIVAYGADSAHSTMYYGRTIDQQQSDSPDAARSAEVARLLLEGVKLGEFLTAPAAEVNSI